MIQLITGKSERGERRYIYFNDLLMYVILIKIIRKIQRVTQRVAVSSSDARAR